MKKLQNIIPLLAFVAAMLLSTGCNREDSDSVDQDKIHVTYELFYNQNEDKTYARATFQFSNALGTKLELVNNAEVSFEGDVLAFKQGLAYYEKEYAGFVNTGTFTYMDLDGNTFQNTVTINEIAYPAGLDSLARDAAYELIWQGDALAADEDVIVTINGVLEGDVQSFSTNADGATSIILDRDKLEQLGEGEGTVWMDRRNMPEIQQGTSAGGILLGRYRPTNATPYLN
ncbi:MAG: hypothetical protein AAF570_17190 [Bacteroidota bacterium]